MNDKDTNDKNVSSIKSAEQVVPLYKRVGSELIGTFAQDLIYLMR